MTTKVLLSKNTKTEKGLKLGVMTFALQLAPHKLSGYQVCPKASEGCALACLNMSGMGVYSTVQAARIKKTKFFFEDREAFMALLVKEVKAAIKKATKEGYLPAFRLNTISDIGWEKIRVVVNGIEYRSIMEAFPTVQFYDYTAIVGRKVPDNYHLTFSRKESNQAGVLKAIESGMNVAAVFKVLPETYLGIPVIDGDLSDVRFLDAKGVIVGLKAKGPAKKDTSGFVILVNEVEAANEETFKISEKSL